MTTEAPQSTSDMQALYDALTSAAGEDGRTRVGYDEALRSAGTIGQFSSNGELDDARVEAAARGLIEQGLLEVRGPGYKYVGGAVGRSSGRSSGRGRKRATSKRTAGRNRAAARKTTARSTGGRRSAAAARGSSSRGAASGRAATARRGSGSGSGSPYLADTLRDLLAKMTDEVSTVTALSGRIDSAAQELQAMISEYCERIATLAQLRATTSEGPLAAFLAEELRPERPSELQALDQASDRAQRADV
jgi:hypothetical protein